jgi:hypothetical protein
MRKSRISSIDTGNRAMDVFKKQLPHRRRTPRETFDHGDNRSVTQLREEVRFPVVEGPFGVPHVNGPALFHKEQTAVISAL